MFLLDEPFVSDFLVRTIKDKRYKIIATPVAKELVPDSSLNWIGEKEALEELRRDPSAAIYSNSENALAWIDQNLGETALASRIGAFKDKVKFRDLLRNAFPDFRYEKISLGEIQDLSPADLFFPLVIKPSVGFFSIGVHIVKNQEDWERAKGELKPENLESIFPENVLNTAHFIIEEFVDGEEYAVDFYYDDNGEVVVLNVMHHLFSSGTDTSDRVYSTSKEIIHRHKAEIEDFLNVLGEKLNLKNFPAHAEVRVDRWGKIVPIEVNPLRFGGWCTTGDLLGLTLGFNSYSSFVEHKRPDWDELFRGREDKLFSIVILNNNSGISPNDIGDFNYSALSDDFENPVVIRRIDIREYPVFGFVFAETSARNAKELSEMLNSDLKKYITRADGAPIS